MTVTGYEVRSLGGGKTAVCPFCVDTFDLNINQNDVSEITTSQYRHGGGELYCALCGFNTLDTLSKKAVDNNEPDGYSCKDDSWEPNEEEICDVLQATYPDGFCAIESGETLEYEVRPGVTISEAVASDADTIMFEVPSDSPVNEFVESINEFSHLGASIVNQHEGFTMIYIVTYDE